MAFHFDRIRRLLESYRGWQEARLGIVTTLRWLRVGASFGQVGHYVASEFPLSEVRRWRRAGFSFADMDAFLDHKMGLEEAAAWRRRGFDTATATEWGRYRLTPTDVEHWGSRGYRAQAADYWISCGLSPDQADSYYVTGELPAEMFAAHRGGGWLAGTTPAKDAPPDRLVSWDDTEEGPRPQWWV